MTVGAVIGSDGLGTNIESYSALGPINLLFPSPTQLQAPMLVAPDAIYVDAVDTSLHLIWAQTDFFMAHLQQVPTPLLSLHS